MAPSVTQKQFLLVLGLVLLIRVPFLNQAIQGDDHIYLTEASHALIDPLHPDNTTYVFQGEEVDLRGQPHPPLDGWVLAALIAVIGGVKEVPFHAAYMLFSLIAACSMWSLARRFSPHPLWAALLFVAVPAFVVNGNSLETDLPFLAFWMAAVALFEATPLLSALSMALAAFTAYQAVLLTPILAVYVFLFHRRDRTRWLILLVPPFMVVAWQLFERLSTGALPAAVLNGYLATYQPLPAKLASALALTIHSWFIVFPALVPPALVLAWRRRREPDTLFLLAWIAIFFAGALVIFFAGSARYLLPMAAPVALLASRLRPRWLAAGFALQLALGLSLAAVNYQHWAGYRQFAESLRGPTAGHRVWVDGEWGLRYYLESDGALPLKKTQRLRPGDIVVSSELSASVNPTAPFAPLRTAEIRPALPLRLIGLESHSGYSTVSRGFWPFGFSAGLIDRLSAREVTERHPTLAYLPMNAPEAAHQIVVGIFSLEDNRFRWMSRSAVVALANPAAALPLRVTFTIPPQARARRVTLLLDGREVASQTYPASGTYTLESPPVRAAGAVAMVEIAIDQTFSAPGDSRELGIVLTGVGFAP
jgi:4-amino-4-deoxy-L-arabinose transferase-like glycosyltransferase